MIRVEHQKVSSDLRGARVNHVRYVHFTVMIGRCRLSADLTLRALVSFVKLPKK